MCIAEAVFLGRAAPVVSALKQNAATRPTTTGTAWQTVPTPIASANAALARTVQNVAETMAPAVSPPVNCAHEIVVVSFPKTLPNFSEVQ